ncbi:MAG: diacylglycerol kinase [Candidatus Paceibacteria bacterium]|jgi:diacylglycerol kinase
MLNSFLGRRLLGCKYAISGAIQLIKNEASIQVQTAIAIGITIAGIVFKITATEWMLQCFAIGLVLTAEGLNTAAEEIVNFIHPSQHPKIGYIKDVAAGAVFFAAITAIVIAGIIYIPKF